MQSLATFREYRAHGGLLRRPWGATLITVLAAALISGCAADPTPTPSPPTVTVMTQNLYMGFDAVALLKRPTPANVEAAFSAVQTTDFVARARALAEEIAVAKPHLVALQEAMLYRTQTPGDLLRGNFAPNATMVAYDFVSILVDALRSKGMAYSAATMTSVDIELPGVGRDIRLTDRDVILTRDGTLEVTDVQEGNYAAVFATPSILGPVPILRGWVFADVEVEGKAFRIVATTLESLEVYAGVPADVQVAQARELLAGPAATALPVLLVGDLSSAAAGSGFSTPTYAAMVDAGFVDAWTEARPGEAGFTCCQSPALDNGTSDLDVRLDFVLYRGGFSATGASLVGAEPSAITGAVRWPSDHAGVVVTLELP